MKVSKTEKIINFTNTTVARLNWRFFYLCWKKKGKKKTTPSNTRK